MEISWKSYFFCKNPLTKKGFCGIIVSRKVNFNKQVFLDAATEPRWKRPVPTTKRPPQSIDSGTA